MTRFLLCLLPLWLFAVPAHALTGDSMRGEKLHAKCLDCHGTGLYAPDKRKIVSLKALRKDVKRWEPTTRRRLPTRKWRTSRPG